MQLLAGTCLLMYILLALVGEVLGPDGDCITDTDGQPILIGPNTHSPYSLGADGTIFGPDNKPITDSEGNIIKVKPSGEKIILEPSGKLTLDDDRNTLAVPEGSQLVAPSRDGKVKVTIYH